MEEHERALRTHNGTLMDKMLELQKKYHEARMERDKELYERQIKIVDAQIDWLFYELYGLTEDEVKVVEGHSKLAHSERKYLSEKAKGF